jgi:hypothetical protein
MARCFLPNGIELCCSEVCVVTSWCWVAVYGRGEAYERIGVMLVGSSGFYSEWSGTIQHGTSTKPFVEV